MNHINSNKDFEYYINKLKKKEELYRKRKNKLEHKYKQIGIRFLVSALAGATIIFTLFLF